MKGASMKGILAAALFCLFSLSGLPTFAAGLADVEKHPCCQYCGMDRETFAHSRVLIEYEDGSASAACSLHCAAVDLANNIDKTPTRIAVADYYSKKLIDAEKAYWVVGGGKQGVMTSHAKWAFEAQGDAEKFQKANGGARVGFDEAIRAAYNDMYGDIKQIRERRKMMKSKKAK